MSLALLIKENMMCQNSNGMFNNRKYDYSINGLKYYLVLDPRTSLSFSDFFPFRSISPSNEVNVLPLVLGLYWMPSFEDQLF